MKNLIVALSLLTMSFGAFANIRCQEFLKERAVAKFEATDFVDPDAGYSAVAYMDRKYPIVIVHQMKARFKMNFQIKNDDQKKCEIQAMTDFKELKDNQEIDD
ncbi:MAG: hypothetical protein K2Q18_01880 [Bdellovibrionales bacterium]|nr:hypothetical protein [Bdellovibrionales bacterium]